MPPRSNSGSDSYSSSGQSDYTNARIVTQPRYGLASTQQSQSARHPLQDFLNSGEDAGFGAFSASRAAFPTGPDAVPRSLDRRGSDAASMAATFNSSRASTWGSTASSNYAPSLASGSTAPSTVSDRSSGASPVHRYRLPDEDEYVEQGDGELSCPYGVLGCPASFQNLGLFETHCQAHFQGVLPKFADCPFAGCDWSVTSASGEAAWKERARHMSRHMNARQLVIQQVDSKHEHVAHLWRMHQVSNGDQQQLRRGGELASAPAVMRTAGSERDPERQRLRDQRRAEVARRYRE